MAERTLTAVVNLHGRRGDPAVDPMLNSRVTYVGRYQFWGAGRMLLAHPLANPFSTRKYNRYTALSLYADRLLASPTLIEVARGLAGGILGCWCHPLACHADLVACVADGRLDDIQVVLEWARGGGAT